MNTPTTYPVADLLRGSVEIDRKKAEIQRILGMLKGSVEFWPNRRHDQASNIRMYKGEFGAWHITTIPAGSQPALGHITYIIDCSIDLEQISAIHVGCIHADLQVLIDAFVELFPKSLRYKLQPFMDASKMI